MKFKPGDYEYCEIEDEKGKKSWKWDVITDKDGSGFFCDTQIEAEILSRIIKIEEKLKS